MHMHMNAHLRGERDRIDELAASEEETEAARTALVHALELPFEADARHVRIILENQLLTGSLTNLQVVSAMGCGGGGRGGS